MKLHYVIVVKLFHKKDETYKKQYVSNALELYWI